MVREEGNLIRIKAPVNIIGDVHGQLPDLIRLFQLTKGLPHETFLFLGDYVDRGKWSVETITLLLAYKVKYPKNVYLLRGNHECASINRVYGFYDDCKRKYSIKTWKSFTAAFDWLPLAAIVQDAAANDKIFCVHGGLSPDFTSLSQLEQMERPIDTSDDSVACDLLWSDPDRDITGWGSNDRGIGSTFGTDIVRKFLEITGCELICRAHQVVEDGYEFFSGRRLITIFSAPNYCGRFDNAAAMLCVGKDMLCRLEIIKPKTEQANPTTPK